MANTFFEIYSELCKSVGQTPNSVARIVGASSGSVTAWKNGTEPRNSTVTKIADYFGVSTDYLLGRTDSPNDYLLYPTEFPKIIKPFVSKYSNYPLIITVDGKKGTISPEKLSNLLEDEMKLTYVKYEENKGNALGELLSLLPEQYRNCKLSLYDVFKIISSNQKIMDQLYEIGYNEQGELCLPHSSKTVDKAKSISDDDIKAAFFNGADPSITKEEMDAMWDDAKAFIQFKMEQRKRSKNE